MSYTVLYSLLKYPAGVVPITKVNAEDQQFLEHYVGHYDDHWDQQIKQVKILHCIEFGKLIFIVYYIFDYYILYQVVIAINVQIRYLTSYFEFESGRDGKGVVFTTTLIA